MTPPRFEDPHLFIIKAQELPLSRDALIELMRAVLSRNLPFRFCARGWSMAPFIHNGDVITISPLQHANLRVGKVAAFIRPGQERLVVHRIIARRNTFAIFRGDNEFGNPEEIIPLKNLLGVVTRIQREGKDIWLGLGIERYLIAWLSRYRLLTPLSIKLRFWLKPFIRRFR